MVTQYQMQENEPESPAIVEWTESSEKMRSG